MPASEQFQRSLTYTQAKHEGQTLPCGDKWKEFTYRSGTTEHYCTQGHVFRETATGNFIPVR